MVLKKFFLALIAVLTTMLGLTGCYYDETVIIEEEETREISFSQDIIPILNASCNASGCHNLGGTPPVLTADKAYNELQNGNYLNLSSPADSELYQWLTGKRTLPMPLSGSDPQINSVVLAWIKQGAPNN